MRDVQTYYAVPSFSIKQANVITKLLEMQQKIFMNKQMAINIQQKVPFLATQCSGYHLLTYPPFFWITDIRRLSAELVSSLMVSLLTPSAAAFTACHRSSLEVYCFPFAYTDCLMMDHKFSMGLRSGEQGGHNMRCSSLMPCLVSQSLVRADA